MTDRRKERLFDLPAGVRESLIQQVRNRRAGVGTGPEPDLGDSGRGDVIPEEFARFEGHPAVKNILLQRSVAQALKVDEPFYRVHEGRAGNTTRISGRDVINFSSYDYLGLNQDPRVAEAAKQAIDAFGTSVSASRLVGGERPVHGELEEALAGMLGAEASVCFVSGVVANMTTIATLLGARDLVAHDSLIHNSVLQGIRLSGASRLAFPHNDWEALDQLLSERRDRYERVLVVLEGLYSMDGDVPDLPRFVDVKRRHRAFLMVDEAHSIGVLGDTGRGAGEHFGVAPSDVDIWMGTLSKTLSGCGGYIAGERALTDFLRYAAPGFIFSVGMSPALASASLESLRIMRQEPERVRTLRERSGLFHSLATQNGVPMAGCAGFAVIPVVLGDSLKTLRLAQMLFEQGIHVPPAIPPGVEPARSRLRFFINATHTEDQIHQTVDALAGVLREVE